MTDFLPPVVGKLAADISDYVAGMAAAEEATKAFTRTASGHLDEATADFRRAGAASGEAFADGLPQGAREAADRAVQDVTSGLHSGLGDLAAEGEYAGEEFGDGVGRGVNSRRPAIRDAAKGAADDAESAFSKIASVSWSGALVAGVTSAVGALAQLAPVAAGAAAALSALPAAAAGGAGALAALGLGFHGIGSAISAEFQPAMGAAAHTIDQTAQAEQRLAQAQHTVETSEHSLEQAQRQSLATQQAVNQARLDAVQNIKDLALAEAGGALAVEQAQLNVTDATKAYNDSLASGDPDQIYRADLALREAQEALAEATNQQTKNVNAANDANAKGVQGSDQVQSALQAQSDATYQLQEAQYQLAQAQQAVIDAQQALSQSQIAGAGAASALDTAMAKLAPSARAVVLEIQALQPQLTALQQAVQQRMFAGLAGDLDQLAHAWIPAARVGLLGLAGDFNTLFRGLTQSLAGAQTVQTLSGLFGGFTQVMGQFAALAPAIVRGFDEIVSAATPFFTAIGGSAVNGLRNFLDWLNRLASNGTLQKFFNDALPALSAFGSMLKDAGSIVMSVFQAMGSAGTAATGALGTLLAQLAQFFNSAQGVKVLGDLFQLAGTLADGLGKAIGALLPVVAPVLDALAKALTPIVDILSSQFVPVVVDLVDSVGQMLTPVIQALAPVITDVLTAAAPLVKLLGGALGQVIKALAPVLVQVAQAMGRELAGALQVIAPLFTRLLPPLVRLAETLLPALLPLLTLGSQVFMALMPALVPLVDLLVDLLVPILNVLVPIIELLTPVIKLLTLAIVAIITPIADFIGWLAKALDSANTWRAVGKWFADLWSGIKTGFIDGVLFISGKWDDILNFAKGLPGRLKSAVGDLGSLLVNAGMDVVRGLWNGINSMGDWIVGKLTGFVKDVIPGPIADVLGIHSPSRVAADLARWVPEGLAQGMLDNQSVVMAAANRLATAMLPAAAGGLGGAAHLIGVTAPVTPPLAVGSGQPSRVIVEHHAHYQLQIDGRDVHSRLIPVAQQYKARTGTTGLA